MFALSETEFVLQVAPVRVVFERAPTGEATGVVLTLGERTIRARKVPD
jgi:hypothetical protein